jgi:hypothetical protein
MAHWPKSSPRDKDMATDGPAKGALAEYTDKLDQRFSGAQE